MLKITLDYKKKFLKNFSRLKNNLPVIIIVPTIFGGIIQAIQLTTISPSLFRFFSVSQLIADGIFILGLIFFTVFIPYQITKLFYYLIRGVDSKKQGNYVLSFITFFGTIVCLFLSSLERKLTNKNLLLHFMCCIILITLCVIAKKRLDGHLATRVKEKKMNWIVNFVTNMTIFGALTYPFIIFVALSTLTPIDNFSVLEQKYAKRGSVEILYFNDKYIFIRINNGKTEQKIHVEKIDSLFE